MLMALQIAPLPLAKRHAYGLHPAKMRWSHNYKKRKDCVKMYYLAPGHTSEIYAEIYVTAK